MHAALQFGAVSVHLGAKSGHYPDGNQVLVRGADLRVAFDTPQVAAHIGAAFDAVDLVILGHVHEDHMAGLHRVPRARVLVHEADLAAAQSWPGLAAHYGYPPAVLAAMKQRIEEQFHYAPRPDATAYRDGASWDLGGGVQMRAHHLPGHTAGHCALVVESEGLAFIGDIDLSSFGPYYGDATGNLADFRRTLAAVARLEVRAWVTSHQLGVITDRARFLSLLAAFAGKLDKRAARLLGLLAGGPLTLDELVQRRLIFPLRHSAPWVDFAERHSIGMHLDELIAEGRVRLVDGDRYLAA